MVLSVSESAVSTKYVEMIPSDFYIHCIHSYVLSFQLVDTKSANNMTLLHFLERTVSKHFPDIQQFVSELSAPAEAYRGSWSLASLICMVSSLISSYSKPAGRSQRPLRAPRRLEDHP